MRQAFYKTSIGSLLFVATVSFFWPPVLYLLFIIVPYIALGLYDLTTKHNVLRNYPVIGHLRYMLEFIRPEIQQYFIAGNQSGRPFNREQRSLVYQRGKNVIDTLPFGTQYDITKVGYEFAAHSLSPKQVDREACHTLVGGPDCKQPYKASRLNISAMSFGALGENAILAMNLGAKIGGFAQDTGEGGLTPYHLEHGADVIWEIGTAYFGCRTKDGHFDAEQFAKKANLPQIKMIEIKLSQGAKPSHGGLLPAAKITDEIAEIRGIEKGVDCLSPPSHTAFSTPTGLLEYVQQLRELTNGKPIGFKLCIGRRDEFMGICKAMLETNITPDFITVDGAEGGTGAAPLEFINRLGMPINEAISFVHNCLVGINQRKNIRIIASGKVITGFDVITKIALGADMCNSARAFMFSVGCIQAIRCHTNTCPTGVTTQDKERQRALVVKEKARHVANFHNATMQSFLDLMGAMGLEHPDKLTPHHIQRRIEDETSKAYDEIYHQLKEGDLLKPEIAAHYAKDWGSARADAF